MQVVFAWEGTCSRLRYRWLRLRELVRASHFFPKLQCHLFSRGHPEGPDWKSEPAISRLGTPARLFVPVWPHPGCGSGGASGEDAGTRGRGPPGLGNGWLSEAPGGPACPLLAGRPRRCRNPETLHLWPDNAYVSIRALWVGLRLGVSHGFPGGFFE